jgi:hypothetical protein
MNNIKPFVTIELEEFNKLQKYVKTLEDSMLESPYKVVLEQLLERVSNRGELLGNFDASAYVSNHMINLLVNTISSNNIVINKVDNKYVLSINK